MAATIDIIAKFTDQASPGIRDLTGTVSGLRDRAAPDISDLTDRLRDMRERARELGDAGRQAKGGLDGMVGTIGAISGTIGRLLPQITLLVAGIIGAVAAAKSAITALAEWSVKTEETTVNLQALGVTQKEGEALTKRWGDEHVRAADQAKRAAAEEREAAKQAEQAERARAKAVEFLTDVQAAAGQSARDRAVAEAQASGDAVRAIEAELQRKREIIEEEKQARLAGMEGLKLTVQEAADARVAIEQEALDKIVDAEREAAQARTQAMQENRATVKGILEGLGGDFKAVAQKLDFEDQRQKIRQQMEAIRVAIEQGTTTVPVEQLQGAWRALQTQLGEVGQATQQVGQQVTQTVAEFHALPFGALPEEFELIRRSIENATDAARRFAEDQVAVAARGADVAEALEQGWTDVRDIWKTSGQSANELGAAIVKAGQAGEAAGQKTAQAWQAVDRAAGEAARTSGQATQAMYAAAQAGDELAASAEGAAAGFGRVSAIVDQAGNAVKTITGDIIIFGNAITYQMRQRMAEMELLAKAAEIEAERAHQRQLERAREIVYGGRASRLDQPQAGRELRGGGGTNVNVNVNAGRLAQGITVEQERQAQRRSIYSQPGIYERQSMEGRGLYG
jgi:methyl-accepting chemotaxis protein